MKAVFDAVVAAVPARVFHYLDATGGTLPYLLFTLGYAVRSDDVPLTEDASDLEFEFRLTAAAWAPNGVDSVADSAKSALGWPLVKRIDVAGFSTADVRWLRTETAGVDRDVTPNASGVHPAFRVDSYRVTLTK